MFTLIDLNCVFSSHYLQEVMWKRNYFEDNVCSCNDIFGAETDGSVYETIPIIFHLSRGVSQILQTLPLGGAPLCDT